MFQSSPLPESARKIAAYVCTDTGAATAQAVLGALGQERGALHGGGLSGAARISVGAPIAQIVLAEIGQLPLEAACECVAEIAGTGAELILIGQDSELGVYRALRKAGAVEYFDSSVQPDDIVAAVNRASQAQAPQQQPVAAPTGKTIAVVGCNGGVGASLLAQNMAFFAASAKAGQQRTSLIDGDLRLGSQAIDLDIKDTPGLLEALSAPERVDETFLNVTMEKPGERLALYAYQMRAGQNIAPLEAALPQLIGSLKGEFDAVVVDLPRHLLMTAPEIGKAFDSIILLLAPGYSGVNAASRMIASLRQDAPHVRILPVIAEFRQDAGLSRKDIERGIGQPVAATLPRNEAGLRRAHRAAKPLVEMQPRAPFTRAVQGLWQAAIEGPQAKKDRSKSSWAKFLFRKAST